MAEDKIDLKRLKELDEKATPGPWEANIYCDSCDEGSVRMSREDVGSVDLASHINAEFIAESRTELPRLVAWIEAALPWIKNAMAHNCECSGDEYLCEPCKMIEQLLSEIKND